MSGKPRRRVTVENTKQVPEAVDSKRKPSVFERLGPGAPPRNYDQPATGSTERYEKKQSCNSWMKTGVCNYGKSCRYQHPPRRDHNTEDLRHKVGRRRDTTQSEDSPDDSDSDSDRKSREHVRKRASRSHEKEGKMRSTVVLTKKRNVPDVSDSGSEPWQSAASGDEPGFESELELEKQRQALQRELRTLQEAEAEENRLDNIFIQRETQSSSDSDSSSDASPPPPQKKEKPRSRMPQPEEQPHSSRKKVTPKDKRRKARGSVSKTRQAREASSPETVPRERSRARRGEEHSAKQRPPREPSSDDEDDQSPEPPPRSSKERRRRSISDQRARKRSPSSSDEPQKSPVEQRRKKMPPVEQHHKRSPDRKRKVSQPPPRERPQQQHKEKERERERERLEKEREKEREKELREREREKEQEMREREKARGREKERHEAPRRGAGKKSSPQPPPEKVRSRKVVTPDISPRPEKRQRQESPEYERKRPQKRSETPDARPTRDHQGHSREHQAPIRESRRGAPEPEPKGKRAFSPRDSSASRSAKRHASPVDYKRSRSPETQKVRTPDPPAKVRRGRVEDREGRARTQVSPSDSHRSGSRHNSPDPRTQPNRHVTPEGRTRRDQREREGREVRDQREGREGREGREIKDGARDSHRDQRETREPKMGRDGREMRGNKDKDMQERDTRDQRDMRDNREPRAMREHEPRGDMRRGKERDPRDHEPVMRETKEMRGQGRESGKQAVRQAPIENAINKRLAQLAQSSNDEALVEPVIPVRGRKRGGGGGGAGPAQRQDHRQRHPEEAREPPGRRGAGRHAAPADFDSPVKAVPQQQPRAERRGRKDMSPEQRQAPRTVTPEPKRGGKDRRPAERGATGERGRPPVASPEQLPREREPRNVRGMRDKEGRERDDSRGSRERVERTELEARVPRDMKEREPRGRDMKEVHDERDLMDRSNRSADRNVDRGMDRGVDRNMDRSLERGMDRSMERNMDRGHGAMNRAMSPLMGRGGFDKSRSPPAPRRRITPEPARGRRLSPDDMRSQGHLSGHSPYHDEYDAPMMHPDHMGPSDMMPEEFDHGRGRMGRNDRFGGGHRMPEERFDRSMERDRGDRFEHPPVDDRRFRGRDQYEQEQGFMDRNLMPRDMDDDFITSERDDLWSGDNQWNNNRGRPEQPNRRGVRGRGRDDQGRSRRGRGRGDGRRGEEPFPFRDDQYLEDTPLPQDRWWDDQAHPDDHVGDNRQGGGRRMQGRHGGRGQNRPGDMDRHGGRMFVDDMSDEQGGHKRSYIDDLTPPPKRRELSPSGSQPGGNRGSLGRDMRGDMMLMEGLEPRDGRGMMPHNMRGGSHDRGGPMRDREGRDMRDGREPRDLRDIHDIRENREPRDNWDARDPRDIRDLRDVREPHDLMDPRDNRDMRDNREPRDVRDPKDMRDVREPRDARESRDMREPRDGREPREPRDMRDTRDQREPREGKDVREAKEAREPRDARSREGRGQRDRGRDGTGSDRGGPEGDEPMQRDRRDKRIDQETDVPPTAKRPRSASPSPAGRGRKRQRGPPEKPAPERRGEKPWPDEPKRTPTKEGSLPRPSDSPVERRPGRDHEDSASHGVMDKAAFSDWSDDGEMFGPHNKRSGVLRIWVEEDVDPLIAGRGPGYHEGSERGHRSPSRSSIGSRHSHREERPSGYRSDDMRRGNAPAPGSIQDSWSDGEHGPGEWNRGPGGGGVGGAVGAGGQPHRMPSFQGEPHSPLDVASTPPWERANRRRNRGGSEVPERERPPPPPPGSFGEAEAAVRAHYRNGEEPPPATPQAVPSPAAAPTPPPKPEGDARNTINNKKKAKSDKRNGEKMYDDISDDDLDDLIENVETEVEENKKTSVSDVMDIDWACLVKESQQQIQPVPTTGGSVLSRFSPANVFAQIGVSRAYAGEALFSRLKHVCQRQIDKDASTDEQDETSSEQPATTEPPPRFEILNDVAALHDAEQRRRRERATVLQRIGPFRRALCARRDLILRRYLCRLGQESDVSGIFATPIIDQDLYRQSLQFLRQGSSERKFSALQEAEPMSL